MGNAQPRPTASSAKDFRDERSRIKQLLSTNNSGSFFGLENFGQTCYCNSILQALHSCEGFKSKVLEYYQQNKHRDENETTLLALATLFHQIETQNERFSLVFPDVFVRKFKSVNAQFAGATHQDAQEFLNFILNDLSECLRQDAINDRSKDKHISRTGRHNDNFPFKNNPENIDISGRGQENATGDSKKTKKKAKKVIRKLSRALRDIQNVYSNENSNNSNDSYPHHHDHGAKGEINRSFQSSQSSHYTNECNEDKTTADKTWIEELFQGQISNETTCLNCKTVKSRQEKFLDLSLDVADDTSLTYSLRQYTAPETMTGSDRYSCATCMSKQDAERCIKIQALPGICILQLKRFKYDPRTWSLMKLHHRVMVPFELRIPCENSGLLRCYELTAIVIHAGKSISSGHYVTISKREKQWLLFDDDTIKVISEDQVKECFGKSHHKTHKKKNNKTGRGELDVARHLDAYLLFYSEKPDIISF